MLVQGPSGQGEDLGSQKATGSALRPGRDPGVFESVSRSVVSDSAVPWTVTHQAPVSVRFSGHEYWIGLPFPSPNPRSRSWNLVQGSCN